MITGRRSASVGVEHSPSFGAVVFRVSGLFGTSVAFFRWPKSLFSFQTSQQKAAVFFSLLGLQTLSHGNYGHGSEMHLHHFPNLNTYLPSL